jgi:hypothetical protein
MTKSQPSMSLSDLKNGLVAICLIFFSPQSALSAPVIFNASIKAGPTDIVSLQGHDFPAKPQVWGSAQGVPNTRLSVINHGNNVIHIAMPKAGKFSRLQIKDAKTASNIVSINLAQPLYFDKSEVCPGDSLRIIGRNLNWPGCIQRVFFTSGGKTIISQCDPPAAEDHSASILKVRVPRNLPPGAWSVRVSNGLNPEFSADVPQKLFVKARGINRFKLPVAWTNDWTFCSNLYDVRSDKRLTLHAVGDGANNDQPAIQAAINRTAADGGGTVYLAPGTYKLQTSSGPLLDFKSNVVLQGAGEKLTKIIYGFDKPGRNAILALFSETRRCGICDLSIIKSQESSLWNSSNSDTITARKAENLFLARLDTDLKKANRIELKGNNIVVTNCHLRSEDTLLFMGTCTNSLVSDNYLIQKFGVHLDLTDSDHCVVENNTFCLDADHGAKSAGHVRHGMAIAFSKNLLIFNNKWSTINGAAICFNDGEAILSEGGGAERRGEEIGSVTGAGADRSGLPNSRFRMLTTGKQIFIPGTVIAIINGKGTGQWRNISARQGNALSTTTPWQITPDKTSTYAIFTWSNQNATIVGNHLSGWPRGLWFYQGSTIDTQISSNSFNHMDGIYIEPCQNASRENGQFNPVWNTLVDHNKLSSGKTATYINITADLQQTLNLLGTLSLNNQIFGNEIEGNGSKDFNCDPAQNEGFSAYLRVEAAPYNDRNIPALLGTIFQNNKATNCGAHTYLINGGDYGTTIVDDTNIGDQAKTCTDAKAYWNTPGTHGSVGTVFRPARELTRL